MMLQPVDWIIIAVYLVGCVAAGVWMKRYVRVVDDFAVAGREMDIYLGVASLAATEVGIVTIMYTAQMGFTNGPAGATFGVATAVAMFVVGWTGFVIVPMRDAGVMTIPELFEKRFGTRVRWLAGLVVILGGVLNMGIFLRLGGQFLVHMTGLPADYLEWTMTALLAIVLVYTVLGGMLSVLITDYLQFLVMGAGIVVTSVLVLANTSWSELVAQLPAAHEVSVCGDDAAEAADQAKLAASCAVPSLASDAAEETEKKKGPDAGQLAEKARVAATLARKAAREAAIATDDNAEIARAYAELTAETAQAAGDNACAAREDWQARTSRADEEAQAAKEQLERTVEEAAESLEIVSRVGRKEFVAEKVAKQARLEADVAADVARAASEAAEGQEDTDLPSGLVAALAAERADAARRRAETAEAAAEKVAAAARKADAAAAEARTAAKALTQASGDLKMGNPFNPAGKGGLGWGWVIWQCMTAVAVVTTWQTTIARVLSARDSGTAKKIYRRTAFYFVGRFALPGLWGAAAFLYFWSHGGLPQGVDDLTAMPTFLSTILPAGFIGLMIAAMLAAEMSTDSGYLLTWATVIYNDLIMPVLRRPPSQTVRLLVIRLLVVLIGVFLIFYGLWYQLPGKAWDYLAVTGNIYLASLFTLLVGALYWPRANRYGATAAIILGAAGPLTFLVVNAVAPEGSPWRIAPEVAGLAAFACSFAGMYFGSLIGQRAAAAQPQAEENAS